MALGGQIVPTGTGTTFIAPVADPDGDNDGDADGDTTATAALTGQTVVDRAMVEVTSTVEAAGQLVTVGAQLVMVATEVEKTVDVVRETDPAGIEPEAAPVDEL